MMILPFRLSILALIFGFSNQSDAQQVSTLLIDSTRKFESLHWHSDGTIYSVDYSNGKVYKINLDGQVQTLVSGFANLTGGGFDLAGNFYFCGINSGEIYRLNANQTYSSIATGLNQPISVWPDVNDSNVVYVTEYGANSVSALNLNTGMPTLLAAGNGISGPDGIRHHWNQTDLLIANWNNHQIHRVDTTGNISLFSSIPLAGFMGYLDRVGDYLYVTSITNKAIYRIDTSGQAQLIAGNGSSGTLDGYGPNATFTNPNGIAHNPAGDTLLISDMHSIRVVTNFEDTPANIQLLELQGVKLYPNPCSEILNVSFEFKEKVIIDWHIADMSGKRLLDGTFVSKRNSYSSQIQVDSLPAGIYTISMIGRSGLGRSYIFSKINDR